MPRGRGGSRTPANPAPVSGPGALAQRTDGGPTQPIRDIPSGGPGMQQGDRQALHNLQAAAPMAAAPPGVPAAAVQTPAAAPGGVPPMPLPPSSQTVWGPTKRPNEPVTAGAAQPPDPNAYVGDFLRGLLSNPALTRDDQAVLLAAIEDVSAAQGSL